MNGWTLWCTGLPASGKTTIARALWHTLRERGVTAVVLDSDELRQILTPAPTYSDAERDNFYHTLVQLAAMLNRSGVNAIIAATAPRRAYRDDAREILPRFAEIWVRCPLSVCESRDPKQLYRAALAGTITTFPGIQTPFEPPFDPELIVDSDRMSVEDAVGMILATLTPLLVPEPLVPETSAATRPV